MIGNGEIYDHLRGIREEMRSKGEVAHETKSLYNQNMRWEKEIDLRKISF